jgi:hypothetical protein
VRPRRHVGRAVFLAGIAVFATFGVARAAEPGTQGYFTDDNGHLFEEDIDAIAAVGITKGCNPPSNTHYCPGLDVDRGAMAAFLRRALKLPDSPKDHFVDDNNSIFEDDINAIAEAGITKGCNPPDNTRFCPNDMVSREAMAAFLRRARNLPPGSEDHFTDDNQSIFQADINAIAEVGITKGCNPPANTLYCPGEPVTRGAMAAFLRRALNLPTVPLVLAATLPYPGGLDAGEGFSFGLACIDTDTVTCDLNAAGKRLIGGFEYLGHGMPYLYSEAVEGNHDHAWWVDGDREGYRCAYGFLYDKHPNPFGMFPADRPAELIIRATIVRPLGQGYARVNDSHMSEAVRYFDGSLNNEPGNEISSEDCQASALDDFDYDGYEPQGPDAIRVGLFRGDGEVGDIRDFTKFTPQVPGHFEFISLKEGRVTLVFVLGASNKVSHVFYYDALNSGRIAVEVNGKLLQ